MEKINTIGINLIKLLAMLLEQIEVFQILDTRSKLIKQYTCIIHSETSIKRTPSGPSQVSV